ncbi:MAG: cysteine--tRNA ligase [Candidatus Thermoplasmatota archaeon]|nr:cysteine--tRNA ligase [Candidatus Thermoplasmatota archaeon]
MLRMYNTAKRKVEDFKSIEENKVGMYVCGLTVYNDMHLGHARTYIAFDVIRRWLEFSGYEVNFVQNHTDIDDKIIKKANQENVSFEDITNKYIKRTQEDLDKLQVKAPTFMPKATDYISEMIVIIENLIEKGNAYVTEPAEGALAPDVYFSVHSASDKFGTLTGQKLEEMRAGSRVAVDERKQHPADFVLWKGAKEGEPTWDSPWGKGRPGWHIECSAMSLKYLGEHFDIHGGGIDLKFPHHESEVLQTECHTNHSPMANYWLHSGHLTINNEKMSKSLDNFFLVRDVMKEYSAPVLRFYLLNGHYRSPIDFSDSNLAESHSAYKRLEGVYNRLESVSKSGEQEPEELVSKINKCNLEFLEAMNDDFNTREAMAILFQFSRFVNGFELELLAKSLQEKILDLFSRLGGDVLGLFTRVEIDSDFEAKIESLIAQRNNARAAKDWNKSDSIRDKLTSLGVEIEDTSEGTIWKLIQ